MNRSGLLLKSLETLLILCTLLVVAAEAGVSTRVTVSNPPTEFWRNKVVADIDRVNRFLCRDFTPLPANVRVVRGFQRPQYDLDLGTIYLDQNYIPVELYHEYGHRVLDHWLQLQSSAVRYFRLRRSLGGEPIRTALPRLTRRVDEDLYYLAELRINGWHRMADNLSRSIRRDRQRITRLQRNLRQEPQLDLLYPYYSGQTGRPSLYQLLAPYHELFADTLAVLMTRRWDSIYMAQRNRLPQRGDRLAYLRIDPQMSLNTLLGYRAFRPGLDIDSYRFGMQEARSSYTQFSPLRSRLRQLVEQRLQDRPVQLIWLLAVAIGQQVELRLASVGHYQMSLAQMNRGLIDSITAQLEEASGADALKMSEPGGRCTAGSAPAVKF